MQRLTHSFNDRKNYSTEISLDRFPAINAMHASTRVSDRYAFIPTTRALSTLREFGWFPVQAVEASTRIEENQGFQKHMIRLSNTRFLKELQVGSTVPQILLTNSHAGSAAFDLSIGLFEKICSNGLIVQRENMADIRVLHRGYADDRMAEALASILPHVEPTLALTDQFKRLIMSDEERQIFADAAIELRFDGEKYDVKPSDILYARRQEEKEPTLWNTYNVTQEHIIEGDVRMRNVEAGSKKYGKTRRSRAVKGLDENNKLNRALWVLTERMAALKGVNVNG